MKKVSLIAASVLVLTFMVSTSYAQGLKTIGKKDQADVLRQAVHNAAVEIVNMKGLKNSEKVGVLIVRGPQLREQNYPQRKSIKWYDILPVIPWFISYEQTKYSTGAAPEGEREHKEFSHSPMLEDVIVEHLVNSGKFTVTETIEPFYGDLQEALMSGQTADSLLDNAGSIANVGKVLDVDTMIVGSAAGSIIKEIRRENYIRIRDYFVADISINVRTVDVESGKITDAITVSGVDSCPIYKQTKVFNIIFGLGYIVAGVAASSD